MSTTRSRREGRPRRRARRMSCQGMAWSVAVSPPAARAAWRWWRGASPVPRRRCRRAARAWPRPRWRACRRACRRASRCPRRRGPSRSGDGVLDIGAQVVDRPVGAVAIGRRRRKSSRRRSAAAQISPCALARGGGRRRRCPARRNGRARTGRRARRPRGRWRAATGVRQTQMSKGRPVPPSRAMLARKSALSESSSGWACSTRRKPRITGSSSWSSSIAGKSSASGRQAAIAPRTRLPERDSISATNSGSASMSAGATSTSMCSDVADAAARRFRGIGRIGEIRVERGDAGQPWIAQPRSFDHVEVGVDDAHPVLPPPPATTRTFS